MPAASPLPTLSFNSSVMRWASFGPTPAALVNALWSPLDAASAIFSGVMMDRMRQRGLGADAGDAGQHLKAVALLLGSKAVERDVVLGDVHNRINGPLLPGGGQGLAGGGGDLDK